MKKIKMLFLLKKHYNYGEIGLTSKAGLSNSARLTAEALKEHLDINFKLVHVVDGNSIDREIFKYKPNFCVIEALWATPAKILELTTLHPTVKFVIRIHSKIPFLANEGVAIDWIKQYNNIPNTFVGFNDSETARDFLGINLDRSVYLPNIYETIDVKSERTELITSNVDYYHNSKVINIGCFGAIRPLKNQLLQATIAMQFAEKLGVSLNFHINGTRIEQKGDSVLKNMRALFAGTKHTLVEHNWLGREEFLDLITTMDLGMQLSFTESFNIVTADFVLQGVPIIVGKDIDWMPFYSKVDIYDTDAIIKRMGFILNHKLFFIFSNKTALNFHNAKSLSIWDEFINN